MENEREKLYEDTRREREREGGTRDAKLKDAPIVKYCRDVDLSRFIKFSTPTRKARAREFHETRTKAGFLVPLHRALSAKYLSSLHHSTRPHFCIRAIFNPIQF